MKIIVIGAGISGLTFAAAMNQLSPQTQVEIYERDASATMRNQGYSLGLKGDAGLSVLKTLGLYEPIAKELVTISNFVFANQRGKPMLELSATGDEKRLTQRVDRSLLKATLQAAIGVTPIHFGMACRTYHQTPNGVTLEFDQGQHVEADYVIACDGVASPMRQQMIGDDKRYLGLTAIVGDAPITLNHPLLEGGYFMTLGDDGSSLFCYRQQHGIHLSYTSHAAEGGLAAQSPAALRQRLQQATQQWHDPIPAIAAALDPTTLVVRGYYDKEPTKRVRDGRVWLIGDAAHPMCPFQGQGANMGMVDGLKLAQFFVGLMGDPGNGEAQAIVLEKEIVQRGRKAVLASRNAAKQFHVTNRLQQSLRNVGFQMGNWVVKLMSRKK